MSVTHECTVCWYGYDPAVGDDVAQIPAGTGFSQLPADWICPRCDAPLLRFVEVVSPPDVETVATQIVRAYAQAAKSVHGLPICNAALHVDTTPFVQLAAGVVGVVVTPWFMGLVLVPAPTQGCAAPGSQVFRALPAGDVQFTGAKLHGVGGCETCSLFSPMERFADHAAAMHTARECLALVLQAPTGNHDAAATTRRGMLQGMALR